MKLMLAEPFKTLWAGRDAFAEVERLQGEVYRELEARRTLRTEVDGRGYFVKIHRGIGWGEIVKNLVTAKLPVLGAGQEWQAIERLQAIGVPTMTAVAYGERGSNPADQHSFIITEELAPTVSLEDFSINWAKQPPEPRLKRALIAEVARMTGMMHRGGVNHRDCYICHFLLHTDTPVTFDHFKLSVIDLHRAQTRDKISHRWRDKDLAALYFSALDIGLTRRDKLRFLKGYFQQPLRQILAEESPLLQWLQAKADKLYARKTTLRGRALMAGWNLEPAYAALADDFGSLEAVFALQGEQLTRDPLSEVIRVERGGVNFYVKRYVGAGKGLRRYLGKPRVKSEWQNLKRFARWGIPTADVVAWGLERKGLAYARGAMITRELPRTADLSVLADRNDACLKDPKWVSVISRQLAEYTRTMHEHRFTHNDLKWRNLLVDDHQTLYLIDCPNGDFWRGFWLKYRITKDLACLDKVAKYHLSATQRLRFYLQYRQRSHLTASDKQRIRHVVKFFEGRE